MRSVVAPRALDARPRWWTTKVAHGIATLTFNRPWANWMSLAAMTELADLLDELAGDTMDGPAHGGGCEIAPACSVRLGGERAHLGQPQVTVGFPGTGSTQPLPRLVGPAVAAELDITGGCSGPRRRCASAS